MSKLKIMKFVATALVAISFAVSGVSVTANAQDLKSWQKAVNKKIAKKQVYPKAALRKELEGKARVEINIDREGNIVNHSLAASTGHDVLDREVGKLMKRVSPLPAPPAGVSDSELTMVVPLAWAIQ